MCFSLEADLVAGAAVLPVGVLSLRSVRSPRELPFASLPLLFSAHQLVEALVWGGADGDVSRGVAHAAAVAYVVFALPVLPTLVPVAVWLIEKRTHHLRVLPFLALGVVVSAYLLSRIVTQGVQVRVEPHALVYSVGLQNGVLWTVLYIVAVVGACMFSGYRSLLAFGLLNLVGLVVVGLAYSQAFASLWCVYAALASVLVLVHMRRRRSSDPLVRAHEVVGR